MPVARQQHEPRVDDTGEGGSGSLNSHRFDTWKAKIADSGERSGRTGTAVRTDSFDVVYDSDSERSLPDNVISLQDSFSDNDLESESIPDLQLDLAELKRQASKSVGAFCTNATRLCSGSYHEIFVLDFQQPQEGHDTCTSERVPSSCIARCARTSEPIEHGRSTIATIRCVKAHTDLPVPCIFYADVDPNNKVGAPYVLMEKLPGETLASIWDDLSLAHKKAVVAQIAGLLQQLASLEFAKIGCLQDEGVGPLYPMHWSGQPHGPFQTSADYLTSFISDETVSGPEEKAMLREVSSIVRDAASSVLLEPPFRLIHADFDRQNLMFTTHGSQEPRLSGIIDWDHAYTGPLYYLFDYPIFLQDVDGRKDLYFENKVLRQHLVRSLQEQYPDDAAMRDRVRRCFSEKTYELNEFFNLFVAEERDSPITHARAYLRDIKGCSGTAYSGRIDYKPEEIDSID